jgi:hypothetical protein
MSTGLTPGYKQTKVGVIPENWKLDQIENLAQITTGARNTQGRVQETVNIRFLCARKQLNVLIATPMTERRSSHASMLPLESENGKAGAMDMDSFCSPPGTWSSAAKAVR